MLAYNEMAFVTFPVDGALPPEARVVLGFAEDAPNRAIVLKDSTGLLALPDRQTYLGEVPWSMLSTEQRQAQLNSILGGVS